MIGSAVNERVGGTEAVVFLAQRSPTSFREGLVGGAMNGMGTPYVETNQLGWTHGTAFKRTTLGVVGFGSQMVPIFFGQGIEFRMLRRPATTNTEYSFQIPIQFVMVNPLNATSIVNATA